MDHRHAKSRNPYTSSPPITAGPLSQQHLHLVILYNSPQSLHATNEDMNPCWTCRNRRVQCDNSGTPCAKCEKAGVECFDKRPLRWVKGVAIRGKMQGYSYEGKPDGSMKVSRIAKNARSKRNSPAGALVRSSESTGLPITLQDPSMLNLDQTSKYYIDYCKYRYYQRQETADCI
jgi:hypothetical protein